MLINVGRAATEEHTAAAAAEQTPGKTFIGKPLKALPSWAERYPSASLCQVCDPVKACLTDAVL